MWPVHNYKTKIVVPIMGQGLSNPQSFRDFKRPWPFIEEHDRRYSRDRMRFILPGYVSCAGYSSDIASNMTVAEERAGVNIC